MSSEINNKSKITKNLKVLIPLLAIPVILLLSLIAISTMYPRPTEMELVVYGLDDTQISTTDYLGKIQIVEFMTTTCSICKEITNSLSVLKSNAQYQDIIIWSVAYDPVHDQSDVLSNYITSHNLNSYVENGTWIFARDLDHKSQIFQVNGVPHTFLLDQNLKIVHDQVGSLSLEEIITWIDTLEN
ncbi:MAG: TlpA family protein disulfide reductase [Candidatus Hodarchaeales archaeon]|jgi:cytochrome oxidase Cu insertion factor (SCO1/SenC/PrrC family)